MKPIQFFTKAIIKFVLYVCTSFILMLTVTGLMSGRFPPPYKEYYKQIMAINESMKKQSKNQQAPDLADSIKAIADGKKQREELITNIQHDGIGISGNSESNVAEEVPKEAEPYVKRIKYLEYEVAYYKAKFARSEWEKAQINQSGTRLPASANIDSPNTKK